MAIEACIQSKRKIVVIGEGKSKQAKKYEKSGYVTFTGRVNDEQVADYLSKAKALLFPGIEDFGIIPVEANSAGCPVLAYKKGGAIDSIKENITGLFFEEQTVQSIIDCIDKFESMESQFTNREAYTAHVQQFSKNQFIQKMNTLIAEKKHL